MRDSSECIRGSAGNIPRPSRTSVNRAAARGLHAVRASKDMPAEGWKEKLTLLTANWDVRVDRFVPSDDVLVCAEAGLLPSPVPATRDLPAGPETPVREPAAVLFSFPRRLEVRRVCKGRTIVGDQPKGLLSDLLLSRSVQQRETLTAMACIDKSKRVLYCC